MKNMRLNYIYSAILGSIFLFARALSCAEVSYQTLMANVERANANIKSYHIESTTAISLPSNGSVGEKTENSIDFVKPATVKFIEKSNSNTTYISSGNRQYVYLPNLNEWDEAPDSRRFIPVDNAGRIDSVLRMMRGGTPKSIDIDTVNGEQYYILNYINATGLTNVCDRIFSKYKSDIRIYVNTKDFLIKMTSLSATGIPERSSKFSGYLTMEWREVYSLYNQVEIHVPSDDELGGRLYYKGEEPPVESAGADDIKKSMKKMGYNVDVYQDKNCVAIVPAKYGQGKISHTDLELRACTEYAELCREKEKAAKDDKAKRRAVDEAAAEIAKKYGMTERDFALMILKLGCGEVPPDDYKGPSVGRPRNEK